MTGDKTSDVMETLAFPGVNASPTDSWPPLPHLENDQRVEVGKYMNCLFQSWDGPPLPPKGDITQ